MKQAPGPRNVQGFRFPSFLISGCVAAIGLYLCSALLLDAAELMTGRPSGQLLAAGDRRVMRLSPAGQVLWEYPTKLTHDLWMLPNHNVLFADQDTVTEVTPEKKVVFQYRPAEQKGGGAFSCQRLVDGRTLVGENSTGRVLEVDPSGQVVFTLQTSPCQPGQHHNMRMVRKLQNGNYLVCHSGAKLVKEYTAGGKVVWEVKVPGRVAFAAIRTAKGTTLVSSLDQITEYDAQGKKVWECAAKELGVPIHNMTGMHLLPGGNVVVGCYRAYQDGQGCGLFEVSRDKQLVWRYSNPVRDSSQMAVELLTAQGEPLEGFCLR